MAVLMRKPELVKRYCCVLQILESIIDLQNDDKMLQAAAKEADVKMIDKEIVSKPEPEV